MTTIETRRMRPIVAICLGIVLSGGVAMAHETDQFTQPPDGKPLADVGSFLERYFIVRLDEKVEKANKKIKKAVERRAKSKKPAPTDKALHPLQDAEKFIADYKRSFGPTSSLIERTEHKIKRDKQLKAQFPDMLLVHKAKGSKSVYKGADANPLSGFSRLWYGATLRAYGSDFGTDKVGHFVDFGYKMYREYRKNLKGGLRPQQAMRKASATQVNGPQGEKGFYGQAVAGVYSNADLASNYVGCLFFRNLTESVKIKGQVRPPILEKNGPYWKIADHVRQDPKFFRWFVSDHFNEALNPSLYHRGMRKGIRKNVVARHPALLKRYADTNGQPRPKSYFDARLKELATYYGASYGHKGAYPELVSIGSTWPGSIQGRATRSR